MLSKKKKKYPKHLIFILHSCQNCNLTVSQATCRQPYLQWCTCTSISSGKGAAFLPSLSPGSHSYPSSPRNHCLRMTDRTNGEKKWDELAQCGSLTWPVPRSLGVIIKYSLLDLHPPSFWSYLVWAEAWVCASHRVPRWCWCCWSGDPHFEEHWLGGLNPTLERS